MPKTSFRCQICSKTYSTSSHLRRHEATRESADLAMELGQLNRFADTARTASTCPFCNRAFTRVSVFEPFTASYTHSDDLSAMWLAAMSEPVTRMDVTWPFQQQKEGKSGGPVTDAQKASFPAIRGARVAVAALGGCRALTYS